MDETARPSRSSPTQAAGNFAKIGGVEWQDSSAVGDFLIASAIMLILTVAPIVSGGFRSVENRRRAKTLSARGAAMIVLPFSCVWLALHTFTDVLTREELELPFACAVSLAGAFVLTEIVSFILRLIIPARIIRNEEYTVWFRRTTTNASASNVSFDHYDILGAVIAVVSAGWYLMEKHWIANNLIGAALADFAIAHIHMGSLAIACLFPCGLVFDEVVRVFGTDTMKALSFDIDVPIKLAIPQGEQFALIGILGVLVPGLFIALLFRYDQSKRADSRLYSSVCLAAYALARIVAAVIAEYSANPQPVVLYIVPLCMGVPLLVALQKGELKLLFRYRDTPGINGKPSSKLAISTYLAKRMKQRGKRQAS